MFNEKRITMYIITLIGRLFERTFLGQGLDKYHKGSGNTALQYFINRFNTNNGLVITVTIYALKVTCRYNIGTIILFQLWKCWFSVDRYLLVSGINSMAWLWHFGPEVKFSMGLRRHGDTVLLAMPSEREWNVYFITNVSCSITISRAITFQSKP